MENHNRRSISSPGSNLKNKLRTQVHGQVDWRFYASAHGQVRSQVYRQVHRQVFINIKNELDS